MKLGEIPPKRSVSGKQYSEIISHHMAEGKPSKNEIEPLLACIRKLRADAVLGKKKHYNAADRKDRLNLYFGVPPVFINIALGSLLFGVLADAVADWMKWTGALLAFLAAALGGIQTFFNWQKQIEGHRRVASKYLFLSKEGTQLLALCQAGQAPKNLQEQMATLSERYKEITTDAESFSTSDADYKKAVAGINDRDEENYTDKELRLGEKQNS